MTTATAPLRGPLRKRESHIWERHAQDWYIDPSWCSDRLFKEETFNGAIWDPACGSGTIVVAARAAGLPAGGSDIINRDDFPDLLKRDVFPDNFKSTDFLNGGLQWADNIVSNPPFGKAREFVDRALAITRCKVAMLLPATWMLGDKRSRWLEATPLCRIWLLTPRPSMPPGHVIAAGSRVGQGKEDFAWYVWDQGFASEPIIRWLRRDA